MLTDNKSGESAFARNAGTNQASAQSHNARSNGGQNRLSANRNTTDNRKQKAETENDEFFGQQDASSKKQQTGITLKEMESQPDETDSQFEEF